MLGGGGVESIRGINSNGKKSNKKDEVIAICLVVTFVHFLRGRYLRILSHKSECILTTRPLVNCTNVPRVPPRVFLRFRFSSFLIAVHQANSWHDWRQLRIHLSHGPIAALNA